MTLRRAYLDHSATTPLDLRVLTAMQPYFSEKFGNASSIHSFGRETKIVLEESRETVAKFIGAEPGELFFTSGGTESDNYAIKGGALALKAKGKNHIITSKAEHHAVLYTCEFLEKLGVDLTYLPVDEYGRVDPEDVRRSITNRTCLISIMHANNEIGTINPIQEIGQIAKEHGVVFHSDTVQSVGKIRVNVKELSVDLLSISAHKFYGPKGIGAIYVRKGTPMEKFLHGGGQERGRRAGTESVPLVVGLAKAIEYCAQEMNDEMKRLGELKQRMLKQLEERLENFIVNTHPESSMPNILSISFDSNKVEIDGEVLLLSLDLKGVAVSNGSACTSGSLEASHVLLAMGRDEKTAKASIRFSLGRTNAENDVDYAVNVLDEVVKKIQRVPV